MAKGASSRSGPAPDPNALRRDRDGETWLTLPAEGRKGKAPAWPLSKATARESKLWTSEWKRPQALQWERNGQQLDPPAPIPTPLAPRRAEPRARPAAPAAPPSPAPAPRPVPTRPPPAPPAPPAAPPRAPQPSSFADDAPTSVSGHSV